MLRSIILFLITATAFSQSHLDRALSLIELKEYKKSEMILRNFLERNPHDKNALELLGDAFSYQKKWDKAIVQYKKLVQEYTNNANYHYKYGGALAMKAQSGSKLSALGLIGDMRRAFQNAIDLDPTHIEAHWALVDYYVTLPGIVGGSFSKALKYAQKLQEISLVDGYLAKGYVYQYDDKPEQAEYYYKNALKVGQSITCYTKLSEFYEGQNEPDKAINTLEKAHQEHHRNAMNYQIGKVSADYNIQLNKGEKCLKNYLANFRATDGVPKEWAHYRLAQIYRHKKDKQQAIYHINKALELRTDFKQAQTEKLLISQM